MHVQGPNTRRKHRNRGHVAGLAAAQGLHAARDPLPDCAAATPPQHGRDSGALGPSPRRRGHRHCTYRPTWFRRALGGFRREAQPWPRRPRRRGRRRQCTSYHHCQDSSSKDSRFPGSAQSSISPELQSSSRSPRTPVLSGCTCARAAQSSTSGPSASESHWSWWPAATSSGHRHRSARSRSDAEESAERAGRRQRCPSRRRGGSSCCSDGRRPCACACLCSKPCTRCRSTSQYAATLPRTYCTILCITCKCTGWDL